MNFDFHGPGLAQAQGCAPDRIRTSGLLIAVLRSASFSLVPSETFLADGFFGPPPYHPDVRNRIGEYIAIAHGNSFLWWNPRPDRLRSRHGGLSAEEMIVPFIGCRV